MTYPLIGNYGVNAQDVESAKVWAGGFCREREFSLSFQLALQMTLEAYLVKSKVVGIQGIDTRALTRHLRSSGAMRGIISTEDFNKESLLKKVLASPEMKGRDLIKDVTCSAPYEWQGSAGKKEFFRDLPGLRGQIQQPCASWNLGGCRVKESFPRPTSAADILAQKPDGVFLSNGPGDPGVLGWAIDEIKKLIGACLFSASALGISCWAWPWAGKLIN